jgi:tRNA (guanine-N7-)-methyltransferase
LFGNAKPVEIEVGTGKGLFLLNAALSRPETNFFGIEIVRKFQLYAATRFAIRNLPNVKIACADVKIVLREYVKLGSVAAVHVYFPDPWWKKRHKKRLLLGRELVAELARVLKAGGELFIQTDVEERARAYAELVAQDPRFGPWGAQAEVAENPHAAKSPRERRAMADGLPVLRLRYRRLDSAGPVGLPSAP